MIGEITLIARIVELVLVEVDGVRGLFYECVDCVMGEEQAQGLCVVVDDRPVTG